MHTHLDHRDCLETVGLRSVRHRQTRERRLHPMEPRTVRVSARWTF